MNFFWRGVKLSVHLHELYTLLNENVLYRDVGDVKGRNCHSSQSVMPPFPTPCQCLGHSAKHWPSTFSVLHFVFWRRYPPGRWEGLPCCWLPWGMAITILWRWGLGARIAGSHWGQRRGKEEEEEFVYLPWMLLGLGACLCHSKSCPFPPPLSPHYPFPRPPLPSYTDPNFSPIPAIHAIYLASVQSKLSALLVWCLSNCKLLWQRQTMTMRFSPFPVFSMLSPGGQVWTDIGWL